VNHLEGTKTAARISASVAVGATHSHEIDTYGADYVSVDVVYSHFTAAAASYATVLKVQQSDTAGSGQVDVPGLSVVAGAGRTTGVGVNGAVARFNVDCRGKKRYLTVVTTPGQPAAVATVARLSKLEEMPTEKTAAGVDAFVSG
jgi:hypothetical protein